MPRISIMGCSGSGKSTLARALQQELELPWLELDSIHHQADWKPLAADVFRRSVIDFMDRHPDWIIDGNYSKVADLVQARCTDIVWLDVPFPRVMWQLVSRSVRRVIFRTELWNGNREGLRNLLSADPEESVIRWAIKTHRQFPGRFDRLRADQRMADVRFHRLRGKATEHDLFEDLNGSAAASSSTRQH